MRGANGRLDPRQEGSSPRLDVRLPADLYRALQRAAIDDERPLRELVRLILRQSMEARGLLRRRRPPPLRRIPDELPGEEVALPQRYTAE